MTAAGAGRLGLRRTAATAARAVIIPRALTMAVISAAADSPPISGSRSLPTVSRHSAVSPAVPSTAPSSAPLSS
ncbi:hypothetical protein [Kitasatospora sp. DSM 101779]|uniref:hypothetical protein n=1 Tax=Kitasatospora sp. DSM 101779 TaxID=2853165 RepID=UPI0021D926E5|nr:hypothetical protein [Kitasatospora sp. DSM 101779]